MGTKMILMLGLVAGAVHAEPSRYDAALEAYRDGRYAEAVETLAAPPPLAAGEWNLLGWATLKSGDAHGAIAAFERALAAEPQSVDSACGLGFSYRRQGDAERALAAFERAAEGSPGEECLAALEKARGATLGAPDPAAGIPREPVRYRARGDRFWQRDGDGPFEPFYVKGVNMSFARPGKHITEFPREVALYEEWFRLIAEMNANTIRVYTILPPEFYAALQSFNASREPARRLRLIQGIWAELPDAYRFNDRDYIARVEREIVDAIDVIHGNAEIEQRYGHAHGVYRADVSNDVLGFIFGREWEPAAVQGFHRIDDTDRFRGKWLAIEQANPLEAWLTARLDRLIGYEQRTYDVQRPVAWMNWPTLDALHHSSEATYEESLVFRLASGEEVGRPPEDEIYDDDAVSVDETKVEVRGGFDAGLFVSHHVYPYYPDFMRHEPRYVDAPGGPYRAYLRELKRHYAGLPLLVSEYGVPTSRAVGRYHPTGLDHGGHDEASQADALRRMTADILETGCAGGIVFSWIDEWVKRNWMVADAEGQDHLWYNAMDPEESYGLMAMEPDGGGKLRGDPAAWADAERLTDTLWVDSDAAWVWLRLDVGPEVDWSRRAFLIAIDTYGDAEGDHTVPLGLGVHSDVGIEFAVVLHGERSRVLVDDRYNRTRYAPSIARLPGRSGWEFHDDYRLVSNDDGGFTELKIPHGRKFARDGTVYPERIYDAGRLEHGVDWLYSPDSGMIELRLPWGLLNVSDPSTREVIDTADSRRITDGLRFAVYAYVPRSASESSAAARVDPVPMRLYAWEGWEEPRYAVWLKDAYRVLREVFGRIETVPTPVAEVVGDDGVR